MANEKKRKKNRRWFLGIFKCIAKLLVRKPKFIYLGEKVKPGSIVLSNHAAKDGPLALECYFKDTPFRFWGTHEMNEGLGSVYKYQADIFYHQKKHWPLWLARIACVIISPITYFFYRGLNLISTYPDHRLRRTFKESIETLQDDQAVIIFPEDSSQGYFDNLLSFHGGFFSLAKICYNKGMDVPLYVIYYKKKARQVIIDKPMLYSQLKDFSREEISKKLCDRANELKDMDVTEYLENNKKD